MAIAFPKAASSSITRFVYWRADTHLAYMTVACQQFTMNCHLAEAADSRR